MFRQATKFAPRSSDPFQLALDAGFESVEFWLGDKLLDEWEDVVELAKSFAFEYALHFPNRGEYSEEQLKNVIQLYRRLACSALVIHQPMFDQYGAELLNLDPTIRLGVENHFLETDAQLEEWAEQSPNLTLDVEHLWLFTRHDSSLKLLLQTVDCLLTKYGEKIIHIHLPGYLPGRKEHRPQYCSRNMVMKVFTMLADYGYEGFVVSETASRFQNEEELMMDRLLFRRWQKKREERTQIINREEAMLDLSSSR